MIPTIYNHFKKVKENFRASTKEVLLPALAIASCIMILIAIIIFIIGVIS